MCCEAPLRLCVELPGWVPAGAGFAANLARLVSLTVFQHVSKHARATLT